MTRHALEDVFSRDDLARLREQRCITSGGKADPDIAWLLTEAVDEGDQFATSLGNWYSLAAGHGEEGRQYYREKLRSSVDSRSSFMRWCGELMAGWFLERQLGFPTEHVREEKTRTPDYRVHIGGSDTLVEVKTLVGGMSPGFIGALPPRAPLVRAVIKKSVPQLDKDKPNIVLISDYYRPPLLPHDVVDALFRDLVLKIPYDESGSPGEEFLAREGDAGVGESFHTRVGLLGKLFWNGAADCHAHLFHNPYALEPLSPEHFDPWPQFVANRHRGTMEWRNCGGGA